MGVSARRGPIRSGVDVLRQAADLAEAGEPFVLVTVIDCKGSTPRDPGAKMLWRPGAGLTGTVGGGQFEHLVIGSAERHLAERTCGTEHFVLGAEAEQCCGGVMDVFFEYHGARQRLVVFGAGHVARELARVLDPASLELVVVDDRDEWNTPERFAGARRIGDFSEGVRVAQEHPEATLACVMTCSHETDFEILRELLTAPPAFVGLIGSKTKRASLFGRLIASGVDEGAVERVHCPIGLGDMGKAPGLVAVSIGGQVLLEAKKLGTL